ncbi:MFS transporter [Gordonia hydrophobica]|uniref:MFS transporter n=1 Tax=Gordonia hydrophobica TaxID=40516 RepID=A0ABZ2U4P8_9ACTN|nr:MFS transporter [Gordonia hydrophobica]MBM7368344.1 benzoate transport [Gordonia hydrophobica]
MDLRQTIRAGAMAPLQRRVVIICILLTVIDGYEILVTSFTLSTLTEHFDLTRGEQGLVASIGTLGMGIGAAVLSPLSDRLGRRRFILISLVLIVVGMAATGLATSFPAFLACRFAAGLFLGAIVSSVNVLVAEYSSDARRGTVMGIYGVGLPLGAALGGFGSIWLIDAYGWRGPFEASALFTALLAVWAWRALPESVDYLVERRPRGALAQYNAISRKLDVAPVDELPTATAGTDARSLSAMASDGLLWRRTILLWFAYGLLIASFYFANSFTAKLVAESTGNDDIGITTQALIAGGGVIGALVFAGLSRRHNPRVVTAALMFYGTVAFLLFAFFFGSSGIALGLAVLVGLAANGGVAAYYAISPSIYPTAIRSTAVGLMMGVGRVVAFLAPNLAAFLLGRGLDAPDLYKLFGIALAVSGVLVLALHRTYRGPNALDAMETEAAASRTRALA